MEYTTMANSNLTAMLAESGAFHQTNISTTSKNLTMVEVITECNKSGASPIRLPAQLIVLLLALPTNSILLYVLLKNLKTLSPSEVLGLNFAMLGLLYCLTLPLDLSISIKERSGMLLRVSNTLAVLSYCGCPVLLASLCVERYVAVLHPVLFMKLGKWEYRAAFSAVIWIYTCIMAVINYIFTLPYTAVGLSAIINVLFFIMVACLVAIVWALCKKGPGDANSGEKSGSTVKRKAIKNIVAVLIPSTIVYFPMLALIPFLLILQKLAQNGIDNIICIFLQVFNILPNYGVCLGPMFYKARIGQTLWGKKNEAKNTTGN